MKQIEIDLEVFEYLQKKAKPLIDTPNTVLRRLLKIGDSTMNQKEQQREKVLMQNEISTQISTRDFTSKVLEKEFSERLIRKPPYQFMFESDSYLIYFQNFNKESATLWYRVNENPLINLRKTTKKSILCLTNPAEFVAYFIPFKEVEKQIGFASWKRRYLEINIDHLSNK